MIVLFDSWAWIEYIFNTKASKRIEEIYLDPKNTVLITKINIYEVYTKLLKDKDELSAKSTMNNILQNSKLLQLDIDIIQLASKLKIEKTFAMADSLILASAIKYNAKIVTGDPHFKDVKEVEIEFLS